MTNLERSLIPTNYTPINVAIIFSLLIFFMQQEESSHPARGGGQTRGDVPLELWCTNTRSLAWKT